MNTFFRFRMAAVLVAIGLPCAAHASDMRIHLTAFVPTTCEMHFRGNVDSGGPGAFSLGEVQQFCNTPYALTLFHADAPAGARLQLGNRVVSADGTRTVVERYAPPVNRDVQLLAYGVTQQQAMMLGSSMTLLVTPRSF